MIDPNSQDPSKRKSFFDEDSMDEGGAAPHSPHPEPHVTNDRERMTSRYHDDEDDDGEDEDYDRRKVSRFGFLNSLGAGNGDGSSTRYLTYTAGGIGALLVIFIGGWLFLKSSNKGIPVFEPPVEVAKIKPANTGNNETIGMGVGDNSASSNGQSGLASGPEQANPQGLADQFNHPAPPIAPLPTAQNNNKGSLSSSAGSSGSTEGNTDNNGEEPVTPKPVVHPKHQSEHHATGNKKPEVKKTVKKTETHQTSSGHFGVQLASLKSNEAALKQWQVLKKKAPEILGRYSPSVQKAEVNGNAVYRLRVKGLTSRAQVNTLCGQLKAKNVACTIAY